MVVDVTPTLREGDTLVLLIFTSDGTPLPNLAADMIKGPVFITIGNLSSKIRQIPSKLSIRMVAPIQIPIKKRNITQKRQYMQRQTNREVLNKIRPRVLQHLTIKHNPSADSGYYNILCSDGNCRRGEPVLAAWLADCSENSNLHYIVRHACFWC